MWAIILSFVAILLVLGCSLILYLEQDKIKYDINKKLNSVVNQINDSQYYEYQFDKSQDENIKNVDKNINVIYDSLLNAQNNIKHIDLLTQRNNINQSVTTKKVDTEVINLANKFRMSGIGDKHANDDWLRLFDINNTGYYGGFAAKRLWAGEQTYLNGNTDVNGRMNVKGSFCVNDICLTSDDIKKIKNLK